MRISVRVSVRLSVRLLDIYPPLRCTPCISNPPLSCWFGCLILLVKCDFVGWMWSEGWRGWSLRCAAAGEYKSWILHSNTRDFVSNTRDFVSKMMNLSDPSGSRWDRLSHKGSVGLVYSMDQSSATCKHEFLAPDVSGSIKLRHVLKCMLQTHLSSGPLRVTTCIFDTKFISLNTKSVIVIAQSIILNTKIHHFKCKNHDF